jgi:hypothetical protein
MRVGGEAPETHDEGPHGWWAGGNGGPYAMTLFVAGLALAVLVLAGCAEDRAARPRSTSGQGTESPAGPSPLPVWIAVFRTAEDPRELDAAAQDLMDRVGTSVVLAREGCFGGLRGQGDIGPGEYVLGVLAGSQDQLEKAVEHAEQEPVVSARVEDLCPD